jgi:hypothetical protein
VGGGAGLIALYESQIRSGQRFRAGVRWRGLFEASEVRPVPAQLQLVPTSIRPAERSRALYTEGLPSSFKVTRGCRSGRLPEITSAVQRRHLRGAPLVRRGTAGYGNWPSCTRSSRRLRLTPTEPSDEVRLPPVRLTVGTDANWFSGTGHTGRCRWNSPSPLARRRYIDRP